MVIVATKANLLDRRAKKKLYKNSAYRFNPQSEHLFRIILMAIVKNLFRFFVGLDVKKTHEIKIK